MPLQLVAQTFAAVLFAIDADTMRSLVVETEVLLEENGDVQDRDKDCLALQRFVKPSAAGRLQTLKGQILVPEGSWRNISKANGRVVRGFCKNLFYKRRGRRVTFVEPKAVRGQFVEWGPVGELTATKAQKPSQNFVEGIFDALTSYKRFLLTPFLHTPSV